MNRILLLFGILFLLAFNSISQNISPCSTDLMDSIYKANHPEERWMIENAREILDQKSKALENSPSSESSAQYTIPVVFHILHQNGSENISNEQVYNAIDVINEDFRKLNSDTTAINSAFQGIAVDTKIQFALAQKDPNGNCTNGVDRIFTNQTNLGTDASKLNQWPRDKYLNIWVVKKISSGAAGYAYYPSSTVFNSSIDGIVILNGYVGRIGTSSLRTSRSLTHEIGHWLNLAHLWGSTNDPGVASNCNTDDGVGDTPNTLGWTSCALNGTSCGSLDNVQNYMEYSYCSNMFTAGQTIRMKTTLNSSIAGRNNLWSAANLIATGVNLPKTLCDADFKGDQLMICEGDTVIFSDLSYNNVSSRMWNFGNSWPPSSTQAHPLVVYPFKGIYDVSLNVMDGNINLTETKNNYITVLSNYPDYLADNFSESFENQQFFDTSYIQQKDFYGNGFTITSNAAIQGNKSIHFNNFVNNNGNQKAAFISPSFDFSQLTSPKLKFSYSYARKNSTTINNDEFNIYTSDDCGKTWIIKFGLSGSTMATANPTFMNFVPSSNSDWRTFTIPLGTVNSSNVRFKFEFKGNDGNNFYLDDINISGLAVSIAENKLDDNKVVVFPNPTKNADVNMEISEELKSDNISIHVYGMKGELMHSVKTNNNKIVIPSSNFSKGIYLIKINIDGEQLTKKIVVQ